MPKRRPQKPGFFFFFVLVLIGGLVLRLGWLRGRGFGRRWLLRDTGGVRRRLGYGALAEAEDLLEEIALVAHRVVAGVGGLRAIEEGGGVVVGAGGVGEQVGGVVELDLDDAGGRHKVLSIGVLRQLHRVLHEVGPDGTGGARALGIEDAQLLFDVGVVVVADPDDAEEVGGESGVPGVVGGSGFAGGGRDEAHVADACAGAVRIVEDLLHHADGEEGGARIEDGAGLGRVVGDDVAVGSADGGQHPGIDVDAIVGEDGVGAGHFERRGVVGADGHGGRAARGFDAGIAGERGDVVKADHLRERDGGVVEGAVESFGGGDVAVVFAVEVARRVVLIVEGEGGLLVVQDGDGREDRAVAVRIGERSSGDGGVEGRGVDEGLEDGAGGTMGDGVVELADCRSCGRRRARAPGRCGD